MPDAVVDAGPELGTLFLAAGFLSDLSPVARINQLIFR